MTRRFWFLTDALTGNVHMTRQEGDLPPEARVTVREADAEVPFDGVWINGERSYDTWILVDGVAILHSPAQGVGDTTFHLHEQRGGGHTL